MCSNYNVKARKYDFEAHSIKMPKASEDIDIHVFPYNNAPVIVREGENDTRLVGMQFSLVPSFSKEPKVPYVTYNARLETVALKNSFRKPFKKQHCLVPMTGFYESVYEGPYAGNVIQFKRKSETLLFAAGIFDIWSDPESSKQLYSFSILTSEPSQLIKENGHDRTPIFLKFDDGNEWLSLLNDDTKMINFLNTKLAHPDLDIEISRPLKPGWEKRK